MKAVIQRVKSASLSVDNRLISEIEKGLVVYLGIEQNDTTTNADFMAKKIANIRIIEDENGKMNRSVLDTDGQVLLISQFTLCADTSHGNRPSFTQAKEPSAARVLFDYTAQKLIQANVKTKTGIFGADMQIIQHNDGPVTIII